LVLLLGLQAKANPIVIITIKKTSFSSLFIYFVFLNYVVFTQTNNFFLNNNLCNKKILIAPLDWGLGHATRCIVIIQYLQILGCNITIAASGKTKNLLHNELKNVAFLDLPGYDIAYSKNKRTLALKILIQIPKIFKIIRFENKWVEAAIKKYHFDVVISDNRYGLYTKKAVSVFITHQLKVQASLPVIENLLQRINYRFINRFSECWVPDFKEKLNIAGKLSHPSKLPAIPIKYLGPISRLQRPGISDVNFKWIAIISGPEPQRTILENKIFEFAKNTEEKIIIVRGLPGASEQETASPNCTVFNHLNTLEIQAAIQASEFIISRCGYTTVMEILSLQKKSVLIPTPGQTEQEYLALHLSQQHWCYSFKQDEDFAMHLQQVSSFQYKLPEIDTELYKAVLKDFVTSL